jgi:carbohydrate-selective porin OprB
MLGLGIKSRSPKDAAAQVGGDSPLRFRRGKRDRFGIGYSYAATSTEGGEIPRTLFGPRDSQIVEAYYRYQMTPAVDLSPDIQWVRGDLGGLTDGDDAWVYGVRLNMTL